MPSSVLIITKTCPSVRDIALTPTVMRINDFIGKLKLIKKTIKKVLKTESSSIKYCNRSGKS